MAGKRHEDYVHTLAGEADTDKGLAGMLGQDFSSAVLGTQAGGGKHSKTSQRLEIFTSVFLTETKEVDGIMTISYQVENKGSSPVRVAFDFSGTQNMNLISPKEFSEKLQAEVYVGAGETQEGPTLRQHVRTLAAGVSIRTEVKVCEKEWGNTTDNILYTGKVAEAAADPVPRAEAEEHLHKTDSLLASAKRLLAAGGESIKEARNVHNSIDEHLKALSRSPLAREGNQRVAEYNQLGRDIRAAETKESVSGGGSAGEKSGGAAGGNSAAAIRATLDSVTTRINDLTVQDATGGRIPQELMADLEGVKKRIQETHASGGSGPELSECVKRYNTLAKEVPKRINQLISQAPRSGGQTITQTGVRQPGFTIDPRSGEKKIRD